MNDPRIAEVIKDILPRNDPHKNDVARGLLFNDQVPFVIEYVKNTIGPTHDKYTAHVEAVYDIERPGNEFRGPVTNHKLLFHGTPKDNVFYMLRDGFNKAIQSDNFAFGKGIYFTNCASKALNLTNPKAKESPEHADKGDIELETGVHYLFLTEVALGKIKEFKKPEKTAAKLLQDCTGVYGKGTYRPHEKCEIPGTPAIEVPMGALRKDILANSPFHYDEYVVYKVEQCRHKYLVKINVTAAPKNPHVFGL